MVQIHFQRGQAAYGEQGLGFFRPVERNQADALHASGHPCKTLVGGAVLTPEYAAEIGADYYAKDAAESARIAEEVFGQ